MQQQVSLSSGSNIPVFGWGTGTAWYQPSGEQVQKLQEAIKHALDAGFRHIDSAQVYQDEEYAGPAIQEWLKQSGVPRSELFITSKVWEEHRQPEKLREALQQTLSELQVDYLDLYLVHTPFQKDVSFADTWREMEKIKKEGLVKAIGVSNFQKEHLQEILEIASDPPVVNQIEYHVYLQQPELVAFCQQNNITVSSYAGLGPMLKFKGGPVDSVIEELAKKHSASPMQILQGWIRAKGAVVITTTSKPDRMKEILNGTDIQLDQDDVEKLDQAGKDYSLRGYFASRFPTTKASWMSE